MSAPSNSTETRCFFGSCEDNLSEHLPESFQCLESVSQAIASALSKFVKKSPDFDLTESSVAQTISWFSVKQGVSLILFLSFVLTCFPLFFDESTSVDFFVFREIISQHQYICLQSENAIRNEVRKIVKKCKKAMRGLFMAMTVLSSLHKKSTLTYHSGRAPAFGRSAPCPCARHLRPELHPCNKQNKHRAYTADFVRL